MPYLSLVLGYKEEKSYQARRTMAITTVQFEEKNKNKCSNV